MRVHRANGILTVQVDVDGVQSDEEITENVLLGLRDIGEEGGDNFFTGGELESACAPVRGPADS